MDNDNKEEVQEFYNDFTAVSGIEGVSKDQVKKQAKQNLLQQIMASIAEIFAPIIPALVVGGLILGFRNVIGEIDFGNGTIVSQSVFWAGVHSFLWLIGEAIFHMLPVGICWSITKKMGTTQILGIILGCTLVSGQLLNAYGVAGAAADAIPKWDFGFAQVNMPLSGIQTEDIRGCKIILRNYTADEGDASEQKKTDRILSEKNIKLCPYEFLVFSN